MNKMMTTLAAASFAMASAALSTASHAGEVLDRVLSAKTLTVAVGTDWGPISHLNEKHELDGYDVELVKGIAKSLGVEVKFVTPGWDIITAGKWEGRWDIAMGQMVPTKARAEVFDFPSLYLWGPNVAVVHKDSKATKPSDLEGKVVGAAGGTAAESYANHKLTPAWENAKPIEYQFKPGEVKTYTSTNIGLDDLRLGDGVRLDAVLTDDSIARDAIKAGYALRILEPALFFSPGAIAILPGDKDFHDKVAAAVQKMKDDGTLAKLSIKWYGVDYTEEK
ncbi:MULTISPECIES: transporter substrate-binding domain-containing protein [unclassified Mesorhizobium]|uniref:transporter substrate-binding domain-containing protein n=1 Tax=unclassified Mesorhizobium TaxID=325217 RepID=UPI0003CE2B1E|nr:MULTISPECIES: transporter substrate-binding domain-containing protein [unclassified Mesorhizobium]ESY12755.1 amino acid ABC transporter substrate-binding protein [Mesorhizobium sp. LNJC395A00]WJI74750.1 transporter substrate-binding domain-containing protein [Mesorhizobium sp. C395A]